MSDITEDNMAARNLRVSRGDAPALATMRDHRIARQAELEPLCQAAVPPIPAPNRDQGPKAVRAQGSGKALFVLSVLSLLLLSFLFGLWVTWKELWPFEPHVRRALLGFEAIWETNVVPRNPMNTDVWRRISSSDQAKGVRTFVPAKAFDGYTLVTFGESAALIDMGGTVLHQWHSPTRELEELGVRREESTPDTWDYWRPARLLPNGDLIAIVDRMHFTPQGLALIKLDRQSRPIWIYVHAVHHDFDIDQNGNIYVLDQQLRVEPIPGLPALVPPFIDEGILVLSPTGQQLTRISITESFQLSDYRPLLNELPVSTGATGEIIFTPTISTWSMMTWRRRSSSLKRAKSCFHFARSAPSRRSIWSKSGSFGRREANGTCSTTPICSPTATCWCSIIRGTGRAAAALA